MQPARRTFNNRMDRLCEEELIQPTITRETGRREGYVLTEDGRNMFDGWPPLSDIPGLALDGTVRPDSEPRRRS
jgi:DNA-binding HxlR family transcriptional regulator